MTRIHLSDSDEAFDCAPGDTILRAALRAGIGMSYSCNVGSCGNCRFELVEGIVHHLRADPPAWTEKDRQRNRWLGCQATPDADCRVKFRRDPAAVLPFRPQARQGTLVALRALSHDISEFDIRIEGPADFLPGQYALLQIPGVAGPRVYSMSNRPGGNLWQFQIKRVPGGAATAALFDRMTPGDGIGVDGPYGLAYLRTDAPRDLVLLAGGSGLSPMVSIARAALAAPELADRRVHFFFGGRGPADLEASKVLADLDPARLQLVCAASDPEQTSGWTGETGFIPTVADRHLGDRLADCEVYFAGPPAMALAIQTGLRARGVPQAQVHFDEFY